MKTRSAGRHIAARLGKRELTAYQAAPRGGALRVRVVRERVLLFGRALTALTGELKC
jgi:hypothetical protein